MNISSRYPITVLCVSEDLQWQSLVEQAVTSFDDESVHVCCAPSAAAALGVYDGHGNESDAPSVCLVDALLSDRTGRELLEHLQAGTPRLSSALVVNHDEMESALEAVKAHVTDRIVPASSSESDVRVHIAALIAHQRRLECLALSLREYPAKHMFITGASGFLGGQFVRDVLRCSDIKVTALCRGRKGVDYDQRLDFDVEVFGNRLQFVEGDVLHEGLGILAETRHELIETVDEVWHLAAITSFDEIMREKTFAVNLQGTEHVLEFARSIKKLNAFNHISTAYVCGETSYPAVVQEGFAVQRQQFRNPYDESKYYAEERVINAGLPYRIFRPSIVLGEQVSGRNDGQTVYNIAKMARGAKLMASRDCESKGLPDDHHSFRVVLNLEAAKNMTPVDVVNHTMLRVASAENTHGKFFHVTHPEPTSIASLVSIITELLDIQNYVVVDSLEDETLSLPENVFERVGNAFRPYMISSDPVFDTRNVEAAIGAIHSPVIDDEFLRETMVAFYRQYFGVEYSSPCVSE